MNQRSDEADATGRAEAGSGGVDEHWDILHRGDVDARERLKLDSPIERLLLDILESSPGIDRTARVGFADTWREVRAYLAGATARPYAPSYIVFPQVRMGPYRTDFIVAARHPQRVPGPYLVFVVEADGAEFHGADQVRHDRKRQRAIERRTGWDFLRFSGAEITYQASAVGDVIEAYVQGAMPDPTCQAGSPQDALRRDIRKRALGFGWSPILRHELTTFWGKEEIATIRDLLRELHDGPNDDA